MPELPEVETIKNCLAKHIVGKRIKKIEILSPKQFIGNFKLIEGLKITRLDRRAKILIWEIEKGISMLIHLKLTGQLIYVDKLKNKRAVFGHPIPLAGGNTLPGKSTRIIVYLNQGTIFFNDLRKFGWMKVEKISNFKLQIANLFGIEPLSKEFTLGSLTKILNRTKRPIKVVLMDQKLIAGIGNIYANEALFLAKIRPQRPTNSLTNNEIERLRKSIVKVLREGIKYGGSSTANEAYIKPDTSPGNYQNHFRVYQQTGKKCPNCKEKIQRVNLGNRGTFFCQKCQV